MDIFRHINSSWLHFGHIWFMHFGCVSGFSKLCHVFFRWDFISKHGTYQWFSSFGRRPCYFGHFVFMCLSSTFLFHLNNTYLFFLLVFLVSFDKRFMQVCEDIMGLGLWDSIQGPLARCQVWLLIFFGGIGVLYMEVYAPSAFLGNWALVALYLCWRF